MSLGSAPGRSSMRLTRPAWSAQNSQKLVRNRLSFHPCLSPDTKSLILCHAQSPIGISSVFAHLHLCAVRSAA